MMPSGKSFNTNRVKSITSRFEVLSEQTSSEKNGKLADSKVNQSSKKIVIKDSKATQRAQLCKLNNDTRILPSQVIKNVLNPNNSVRENFGPSCNFGNRKRLKETYEADLEAENSMEHSETEENKLSFNSNERDIQNTRNFKTFSVGIDKKTTEPNSLPFSTNLKITKANSNRDSSKENFAQSLNPKILSRQYSDPAKKLQRSPAFRCDRSEKIKDGRKNSFGSDSSDIVSPPKSTDRSVLSKDKLKKLGLLLEDRMKQDNFEFSLKKNKYALLTMDSNENSAQENDPKSSVLNSTDFTNETMQLPANDSEIPKHILDQYAKVIKPKNKTPMSKKSDKVIKSDGVFSDSGVSSESENLISDDLEDNHRLPKGHNFKSIRDNFEGKSFTSNKRDEISKRKLLKRSIESDINKSTVSNDSQLDNDRQINAVVSKDVTNKLKHSGSDKDELLDRFERTDNDAILLSDTLKKVLKQPLPAGPPPKKPPRTFAALPDSSPPSNSPELRIEFAIENKKEAKYPKPQRSKEESKLMLEKLQSALYKHENTGKMLSPRPLKKVSNSSSFLNEIDAELSDSISRTSTSPSTAKLNKIAKKNQLQNFSTESTPKEVHYMCTNIKDLDFSDRENVMNSSNASLNSECMQPSNSFTKYFNSLNCGNMSASTSIMYTKFGSTPNARSSLSNICCSCNFSNTKDKSKSHCNGDDIGNKTIRLSTFSNPNRSPESSNSKCQNCSPNNKKDEPYSIGMGCFCPSTKVLGGSHFSNHSESQSTFFIDRSVSDKSNTSSQYGSLKKSKSQEHIYAEPYEFVKRTDSKKQSPNAESTKLGSIGKTALKPPPFLRTRTQLEDGFGRIREADASFSRIKNRKSLNRVSLNTDEFDFSRSDSNEIDKFGSRAELPLPEIQVSTMRSNRSVDRIKETPDLQSLPGSKVQDILKRLEGNRRSLKLESTPRRRGENIYSSARRIVHTKDDPLQRPTDNWSGESQNGVQPRGLHYMSTKIYDIPYVTPAPADLEVKGAEPQNGGPGGTTLFLKQRQPPLFEKRGGEEAGGGSVGTRVRRQNMWDRSRDKWFESKRKSPTELDRENLSRLMMEIYDTVNEACDEEASKEGRKESDAELSEAATTMLSRSLTEKRKTYVRRMSSRVGIILPTSPVSPGIDSRPFHTFPSRRFKQKEECKTFSEDPQPATESQTDNDEANFSREQEPLPERLFEACALVGINHSTGQPYIKNVFPEDAVLPPQIEWLVFPEGRSRGGGAASDWQTYSLVLTDEAARRSYGYCRRVLPEAHTVCLSLAYCLVTSHRVPSFYYKILQEIESHHGTSEAVLKSVLDQLYVSSLPKPGYSVTVKQLRSPGRVVRGPDDTSFQKNTSYRNSLNLGELFNREAASVAIASSASSNNLLKSPDHDIRRRKSADLSAKLADLYPKEGELSVMKSMEKLYGKDLQEFSFVLNETTVDADQSKLDENCFEREFSSRSNSRRGSSATPSESWTISDSLNAQIEAVDGNSVNDESAGASEVTVTQIKRPLEPRLDEDNLSVLFDSISVSAIIKIFGTLLIERKVVIVGDKLSQLSGCLEALQSILYPFCWQHTLISAVPRDLQRDLLEAPVPILVGLLLPDNELDTLSLEEEGMIIHISGSEPGGPAEQILKLQGDEASLLPPSLVKTLKASLQLGPLHGMTPDEHTRKTRNVLIAEAFLRFFVELLAGYRFFLKDDSEDPKDFNKEQYIKSFTSKHTQYFLEWFTETAMFSQFIHERMSPSTSDFYDLLDSRLAHWRMRSTASLRPGDAKTNYKHLMNKKVRVWRDKLRDLVN